MAKKKQTKKWGIFIILFLIALGVFLYWDGTQFNLTTNSNEYIVNNYPNEENPYGNSQGSSFDVCKYYTMNYPTYFFVKQAQCSNKDGDYKCNANRLGCYDIPAWDSSVCNGENAQVQLLETSCYQMGGAFTCNENEISCEMIN